MSFFITLSEIQTSEQSQDGEKNMATRFTKLQLREAADRDPLLLWGARLKRELAGEPEYRRALRCLDMLSLPGQFTFTADRPRLHCAAFLIAEPEELITVHYDLVSIDCRGGDFLKVFDGWILKGEKFPSSQDHPLPTTERYIDFCDSGLSRRSIRSSQNVAMIFFRVHEPGNGFTFTIKTDPNLFLNPSAGCGGIGDFVELLGGTGLDPSKMMPLADLCYSFHGPAQMKIGCDNTVVRLVSSGKHINRVTFEYRQLEPYELENPSGNSIQELCLSGL
ncbi:Corticotropin-releasing factor-binding protein [Vulpes lagopus]